MMNALSFTGLPADVVEYILNMCDWEWFPKSKAGTKATLGAK